MHAGRCHLQKKFGINTGVSPTARSSDIDALVAVICTMNINILA
jgi:hypothetical protein